MKTNGWVVDVTQSKDSAYAARCGTSTWYGYTYGKAVGSVTAVLKGFGAAHLSYGNCYQRGRVAVFLNGNQISYVGENTQEKVIDFAYSNGDTLMIKELYTAIIKLNYLRFSCTGGKCIWLNII